MKTAVKFSEIVNAVEFVSGGELLDCVAYIDKSTGEVHLYADEYSDEMPLDRVDVRYCVEVPSKRDLDLGTRLVFAFVDSVLEAAARVKVHEIFRSRGAYRRFRDFLVEIDALERWYVFESDAFRKAVQACVEDHGFELVD